MGIAEEKRELRASVRQRLEAVTAEEAARSGAEIGEKILSSALWKNARSVFLYVSMGKEPDTRRLIGSALSEGKAVYVPKCLRAEDGTPAMLAVRIRSLADLVPGLFSIPEPAFDPANPPETAEPCAIDLALVPCVTVTRKGERLGHGGGYYDRFLGSGAKPVTLCLCFEALLSDSVPTAPHDVPADYLATEEGIFSCQTGSRV